MKQIEQKELWDRIKRFSIDDPAASIKYSDKLAFQNSWSVDYTQRVIEEYKRFIFLCCISPSGASPSKDVDEAWHLHLTYTKNYWSSFCEETLQQQIHHHPSKGGIEEKDKHINWYEETLQLYKDVFEENPPADIWPPPVVVIKSIETRTPDSESKMPLQKILLVLAIPFGIPFFFGVSNPYFLNGHQFLIFYPGLIVASFVALYFIYKHNKGRMKVIFNANYKNDADVYQLTRFSFGRNRSVHAAIVDLVDREILIAERKAQFTFSAGKYSFSVAETNPLIRGLLHRCKDGDSISYEQLVMLYDEDKTYHAGLAEAFKSARQKQYKLYLIGAGVILIGLIRYIQGGNNDKPVGYLGMIMMITAIVYFIVYRNITLKSAFNSVVEEGYKDNTLGQPFKISSVVNQFAFLGLIALGTDYNVTNLETAFKRNTSDGGGEPSSGCGSSGCGSSCGGGGCGGCGGD